MLDRLYQKDQLKFALVWIVIYVVLMSVANSVSASLGVESSANAVVGVALAAALWGWLHKNGLEATHGLRASRVPARELLYYLPLIALCSTNLWFGAAMNYPPLEALLSATAMLMVGFIEEMLFRGFLFNALARDNLVRAIIISSATFGMGHLVNSLNGNAENLFENLLQVGYAIAIGLLFTVLYWRTRSLYACIAAHAAIDVLSVFANRAAESTARDIAGAVFLTVVSLVYAAYLWKKVKPATSEAEVG